MSAVSSPDLSTEIAESIQKIHNLIDVIRTAITKDITNNNQPDLEARRSELSKLLSMLEISTNKY